MINLAMARWGMPNLPMGNPAMGYPPMLKWAMPRCPTWGLSRQATNKSPIKPLEISHRGTVGTLTAASLPPPRVGTIKKTNSNWNANSTC